MAKGEVSHIEMAQARQSDGINVIFDQNSPASSPSRSSSSSSSGSDHYRGRGSHRRRQSSKCRCSDRRYGGGRHRRSRPRCYRDHSRSYSRSSSRDTYSHRRRYKSRSRSRSSRSFGHWSRNRRPTSQFRCKFSQSPTRPYRYRSRSRSSGRSVSLSLHDKRELLNTAKDNAMKILGVQNLELPESVKPILLASLESQQSSPEPEARVRHDPEKTASESREKAESTNVSSPKLSPKRKKIVFSNNNSVVKPTVIASTGVKVTPRVDSYESRKPYGQWVPVKSAQPSRARKHTLMSH
ncbi:arginine/serine-rich protein 1 isoform X2 [Parambassis ranga]|uniref:Arginine/serine-rich protein 1 n=1 Tax=Parambassis ranga TaxID=210632 RepID=A0A6P7HGV7_9TELE|nr:arginine/serine-rich protein 1-like isoform X2 [Parambassis ranga]